MKFAIPFFFLPGSTRQVIVKVTADIVGNEEVHAMTFNNLNEDEDEVFTESDDTDLQHFPRTLSNGRWIVGVGNATIPDESEAVTVDTLHQSI